MPIPRRPSSSSRCPSLAQMAVLSSLTPFQHLPAQLVRLQLPAICQPFYGFHNYAVRWVHILGAFSSHQPDSFPPAADPIPHNPHGFAWLCHTFV